MQHLKDLVFSVQADLEARASMLGLDQVQGQLQPLMRKAAEAFAKVLFSA